MQTIWEVFGEIDDLLDAPMGDAPIEDEVRTFNLLMELYALNFTKIIRETERTHDSSD